MSDKKILVLSVGGSPEPLIISINTFKPDAVYFIHSKETLETIKNVVSEVPFEFSYKTKLIENPESLQESFDKSREVLLELNKEEYNIHIDFTGGTKPMVAGLILASTGDKYIDSCEYTYVGSKAMEGARDKNGVGIVKNGFEMIKPQKDPFETYAILEFNRGKDFFNNYQFEASLKNFKDAKSKLDDGSLKDLAEFYINLVNLYQSWDKFNSKLIVYNEKLDKNEKFKLSTYLQKEIIEKCPKKSLMKDFRNFDEFYKQLENNLKFLRLKLSNNVQKGIVYYLPDLLNNARRKIDMGAYDDGVARLYRSIELIAQLELNKLGLIDKNKLRDNHVFYINREQFNLETMDHTKAKEQVSKWHIKDYEEREDTFKLALVKSFTLLKLFDIQLARDYFADRELESAVKNKRNNSILAHGLEPLSKESANDFYDRVLSYAIRAYPDIEKYMELAKFPKLE
ncbi:TIGR02710 family CRISPR-associated CARF protein [Methanobrevibacter wolinii]|uniref:TIGR02710 family CRISPR-associated CARF protein n=1 Tax=Methanobrevibacter wolinii TaxID=190977 RepID=UPI0005B26B09|nr:TIGR02710 family CRISPR-associated CARF protein [Methanobrevibacter wolinii]